MTTAICCGRIKETLSFKCHSVAKAVGVARNRKSVLQETAKNAARQTCRPGLPPQRLDVSPHKVVCDRLTASLGRSAGRQGSCNATKIRQASHVLCSFVNRIETRFCLVTGPDRHRIVGPPFGLCSIAGRVVAWGPGLMLVLLWNGHQHVWKTRMARYGMLHR